MDGDSLREGRERMRHTGQLKSGILLGLDEIQEDVRETWLGLGLKCGKVSI
jgi:hypothetical protein